jgi:hypothetical protein
MWQGFAHYNNRLTAIFEFREALLNRRYGLLKISRMDLYMT